MLELDVAAKTYRTAAGGTLRALDAVRLSVGPGEFVCITGPSGCGKTTMLRIVLGLDRDFEGSVRRPAGRLSAVFQEPRLLPWRTVGENIRLALSDELSGVDIETLFARLGLSGTSGLYPGELSLGMARRVALARAFAVEPALLTLDEPFVSLDEPTAERLRALLLEVWNIRPIPAVMVTHNLREAVELADRVVVLSARPGRIVADRRIDVPRARRDPATIDALLAELRPSGLP